MTDFRALCVELVDALAGWQLGGGPPEDTADADLITRARELMAESAEEGPTDEELSNLLYYQFTTSTGHGERVDEIGFARAVLARWGNYPESPDSSDGPAVSDDREPASVTEQLKHQLLNAAKADLIRQVVNRALRDTAPYHWRETVKGEQLVRVGDLLTWAEQAAAEMEAAES
jgi:hypothetical protein